MGVIPEFIEDAILVAQETRRQRLQTLVDSYDDRPDIAQRLVDWANYAPALPNGVLVAFARENVKPDSELGQWAAGNGQVALNRQRASRRKSQEDEEGLFDLKQRAAEKELSDADEQLAFLGDRSNVATLANLDDDALDKLLTTPFDQTAQYDTSQLERLAAGKDPTPEPEGLISGPLHDIGDVATTGVRYTTAGFQAGGEFVAGAVRNVGANPAMQPTGAAIRDTAGVSPGIAEGGMEPRYGDTVVTPTGATITYGSREELLNPEQITLYNMIQGDDAGHGFLPGGEAHDVQSEAAKAAARVTFDGEEHALTFGRGVAAQFVEPGTVGYNVVSGTVDFGVAWYADPANLALGQLSNIRAARKLFTPESAGAYKTAVGRYTHGPKWTEWADGTAGDTVFDAIRKTTSVRKLRSQFGENFPPELLAPLQDATTNAQVRGILEPAALTGQIRQVPKLGVDTRYLWRNSRWASKMPSGAFDANDLGNNLEQLERILVTSKVPDLEIEKLMTRAARLPDGDYTAMADFLFHNVNDVLVKAATDEYGLPYADARQLFRFFEKDYDDLRMTAIDEVGETMTLAVPASMVDELGDTVRLEGPHLVSETLNQTVPLPNMRDVRRKLSNMRPLLDNGLVKGSETFADWWMQDIWKPSVLLRGAWTLRVVGEEQARMAAAGLDSLFHHPISALQFASRTKGDMSILDDTFENIAIKAQGADDFAKAHAQKGDTGRFNVGKVDPTRRSLKDYTRYNRGTSGYQESWVDELTGQHMDPVAREVARAVRDPEWTPAGIGRASPGMENVPGPQTQARLGSGSRGIDAVKEWFWEGAGQSYRTKLRDANLWEGKSKRILDSREGADAYIDSVWGRLRAKTGDNPELLDLVATGKLLKVGKDGTVKVDKELRTLLTSLADEGVGPDKVKGLKFYSLDDNLREQAFGRLDRGVQFMFTQLMTKPTNYLSRSPAFKQFYWKEVERLLPYMTSDARAQVFRVAAKTKIKLSKVGTHTDATLDLELADEVAKAFALDNVKKLLYDASERGNSMDALRLVFPFGEAFKEVMTRWAKLAYEQPRVIRRGQQIVEGARGAGFFYTDPQTGEEYFTFPMSSMLTKAVTSLPFASPSGVLGGTGFVPGGEGAPFAMRGRVQGLNIMGNGLPGVGPVIQVLASHVIPNEPQWDWLRTFVSPYGDPDVEGGVMESFFPAWAQRERTAGWLGPIGPSATQERVLHNSYKDSFSYLASERKLSDIDSYEELAALDKEAQELSKKIYGFRGLVQFFAPTAPEVRPVITAEDGRAYELRVVVEDYQRMLERSDGDWSAATMEFIDTYGATAYFAIEPRSRREVYGLPTTRQAELWRQEHSDFASAYGDVYGFFAPQGGDFDHEAYERAIARGDISATDVDEWYEMANDRVASAKYAILRRQVGANPSDEQVQWLRDWQATLIDDHPGYDPTSPPGNRASRDRMIGQLTEAVQNDAVKDLPVSQAITEYLTYRDQSMAKLPGLGVTKLSGNKAAASQRAWLREWGDKLVREHPEFVGVWDTVFAPEVDVTEEELAEVG